MIPVGDFLRRRTTPYVNWALIAANVAVFAYTLTLDMRPDVSLGGFGLSEADRFYFDWGFVPACVADYFGIHTDASPRQMLFFCPTDGREPLQIFTAMFMHAGWAHIIGNMLFLWIFGDNVEDRLGHARYLFFYLLCGLAASATQIGFATDSVVPNVGASGAIAGVLAAYLVLHPRAIVQVIILPFFFLPFYVPAVVLIGFWFVSQLFSGIAEIGETAAGSGVAWWAHVGGFVTGFVLILVARPRRRPRPVEFWQRD
ncbi:MAG TPA: rhomboid family intramembrane serine protease [Dehalococcoidia bacterium]|nr:rhomboid family intramembrane serine protease [Dehalococcoidia bacterium]